MTGETSKVLTLVFTDLADSTALKTARGDDAVGEMVSRHREHVTRRRGVLGSHHRLGGVRLLPDLRYLQRGYQPFVDTLSLPLL